MKSSFSNFLHNTIFEDAILKEGGNAFYNVIPISKNQIQNTIDNFITEILTPTFKVFPQSDSIFPLGSTGKKPQSGDLDLALNINLLPGKPDVQTTLKTIFSYTKLHTNIELIYNPICNYMIQFAYPINKSNKLVKIDLLLTAVPIFTKWYMSSPTPNQSKYKGAHRNDLLRAIPKTLTMNILKENYLNEPTLWTQEDITPIGVFNQTQTIVDEYNNPLKYNNTEENLLPEYAKILHNSQNLSHSVRNTSDTDRKRVG